MSRRENFTAYEIMPDDLYVYMSHNGPHFTKSLCEFAVSKMYKTDNNGKKVRITHISKEEVNNILKKYNVELEYNQLYDHVYVAHMCMADYLGSSVPTEQHLAKYIKDTIDDPDGIEGLTFNRWIADMKWLGIAIPWDEFV